MEHAAEDDRPGEPGRFLIISSWAPPMAGGPRNLWNVLKGLPAGRFTIVTGLENFALAQLDPSTWLDAPYAFFDRRGEVDRSASKVDLQQAPSRFPLLDLAEALSLKVDRAVRGHSYALVRRAALALRVLGAGLRACSRAQYRAVVVISDVGPAMIGGYLVSLLARKPLVVYFFDLYADGNILRGDKLLAKVFEPLLVGRATTLIVTNEETARFFQEKYRRCPPIGVVRNASDAKARDLERSPYRPAPPYRIVFAGHVYWPHEGAMRNLLAAMELLAGEPVSLELYVMKPPEWLVDAVVGRENVSLGSVSHQELAPLLEAATLLFLPFSWNTKGPEIIRTASPAKLTEYLAAGTPILVHAPAEAMVTKLVAALGGVVVTEDDPRALAERIRRYLRDEVARGAELSRAQVELFNSDYGVATNARAFRELIERVT